MHSFLSLVDAGSTILVTLLKSWMMRRSGDDVRLVMILSTATSMIVPGRSLLIMIAAEFKLVG